MKAEEEVRAGATATSRKNQSGIPDGEGRRPGGGSPEGWSIYTHKYWSYFVYYISPLHPSKGLPIGSLLASLLCRSIRSETSREASWLPGTRGQGTGDILTHFDSF